jgi:hypothetical protein
MPPLLRGGSDADLLLQTVLGGGVQHHGGELLRLSIGGWVVRTCGRFVCCELHRIHADVMMQGLRRHYQMLPTFAGVKAPP